MFLKLHSIDTHTTKYTYYFAYSVLIAREPYSLTSVHFLPLSDNIEANVSCCSVHQRFNIPFTEVLTPSIITTETSESISFPQTTEAVIGTDVFMFSNGTSILICTYNINER